MAGCKKVIQKEKPGNRRVGQREIPKGKTIVQTENPDKYYNSSPSWRFNPCDIEAWTITQESVGDAIWDEILPRLKGLETMTWRDILLGGKKQNHSIPVRDLTKRAQQRLEKMHVEQDAVISLRLNGTHRIYGYIIGTVFHILWYDPSHGDNEDCVCRSIKKHT